MANESKKEDGGAGLPSANRPLMEVTSDGEKFRIHHRSLNKTEEDALLALANGSRSIERRPKGAGRSTGLPGKRWRLRPGKGTEASPVVAAKALTLEVRAQQALAEYSRIVRWLAGTQLLWPFGLDTRMVEWWERKQNTISAWARSVTASALGHGSHQERWQDSTSHVSENIIELVDEVEAWEEE